MTLREQILQIIVNALIECDGNKTRAAKMLDVSVRGYRNYLHEAAECGLIDIGSVNGKAYKYRKDKKIVKRDDLTVEFPSNEERLAYRDDMLNRSSL